MMDNRPGAGGNIANEIVARAAPIVNKLHAVSAQALKLPEVRERLVNQGFDVIGSTFGEFGEYIRSELKRWSKVIGGVQCID